MEFSNITSNIQDNQLESKMAQICCDSGLVVDHSELRAVTTSLFQHIIDVILKSYSLFYEKKIFKCIKKMEKSLRSRDLFHINISSKIFVSLSLCP